MTDTHSLIWHANRELRKLGAGARDHFARTDARRAAVYVPALVLVEVGELAHLGRIQLRKPFTTWVDELLASKVYIAADLTADVVRVAQGLFEIPERGDRLIAATALALELPLMTRDGSIASRGRVEQLWD